MRVNYHFIDPGKDYSHYDSRRSEFQAIFSNMLGAEPAITGRVLDVGCGHTVNPSLAKILSLLGELDGVDPSPTAAPPPHLKHRWSCCMEAIPVAPSTYGMAYSYNVVEHVEDAGAFLTKVVEVLKPGGIYWSLSPNAHHPFTWIVRAAQWLGVKNMYKRGVNEEANDYAAYYRLSNDKVIIENIAARNLSVSQVDFYYVHNVQWDQYFPRRLRRVARMMDRGVILNRPNWSFIFMFRIQKAA